MASSPNDSSTLSPLPTVLQHGLPVVFVCGLLSFLSSASLFIYLCRKLWSWYFAGQLSAGCNQFLLLIFNLVLADMQQSVAFLLTIAWIGQDKIDVGSTICWVEGWFVSTGDLASGVWIFAIALHTFFAVIKGHRLPITTFIILVAALWIFIYAMAIIGIALHPHGFYVRAGAWCWISDLDSNARLYLHYLWIFVAMFGSIFVYSIIYITLRSRMRTTTLGSNDSLAPLSTGGHDPELLRRAAKYMVLYPMVYVCCTLPLAAARMAAFRGMSVSYGYYCLAGAAITSCGWLDVLLYACTRRVLIFSDKPPGVDDLGIDTFGILNSSNSFYGMTTTIEGGILASPVRGHKSHGGMMSSLHGGRRTPSAAIERTELFASPVVGMITTKTTIEISGREMTEEELSAITAQRSGSPSTSQTWNRSPSARIARNTPGTSRRTSQISTPRTHNYFPE